MSELETAAETLEHIGWAVSVFGSARVKPESPWYGQAEVLGRKLADAGFTLIAGGGPGLMEAANKGAFQAGGKSVGLNIRLPRESTNNPYQTHSLSFEYFYSRKATFFMHSAAYVALPGGYGTLDELFEVLTLVQTGKVPPAPIVLVGTEFWQGLLHWMQQQLLANGLIGQNDPSLMLVTDSLDEAVAHIARFCAEHPEERDTAPALPE